MDNCLFEQNLASISASNSGLEKRLRSADSAISRCSFCESRSGEIVPAIIDQSGAAHPLHSTIDPRREAERLIASLVNEDGQFSAGFLVILGLGGGWTAEAALKNPNIHRIIIIDYNINIAAELLKKRDYTKIFNDPRCSVLIDPQPDEIKAFLIDCYIPCLYGAIKILPLRSRTQQDFPLFTTAAQTIEEAVKIVSSDYSVQAHFGLRWFNNIIRNILTVESIDNCPRQSNVNQKEFFNKQFREIAICAAGPSLNIQIQPLAERKQKNRELIIIAADTSLPALLSGGIRPDAVVSIDCQHISYYHFMGLHNLNIPLFMDIASPPLLARFSSTPIFVSSSHPLANYISMNWRPFGSLDTSGGNVSYACLSLADALGARRIYVYGADFSYPQGKVYARGTYIFPFFERRQNRLNSFEALISAFLYRSPFLKPCGNNNIYETAALRFYRERFIEKAESMNADISVEPGIGAPIQLSRNKGYYTAGQAAHPPWAADVRTNPHKPVISAREFLRSYQKTIENLKFRGIGPEMQGMNKADRQVFITLLPLAAAIKRQQPELQTHELFEAAKQYCARQIEKIVLL